MARLDEAEEASSSAKKELNEARARLRTISLINAETSRIRALGDIRAGVLRGSAAFGKMPDGVSDRASEDTPGEVAIIGALHLKDVLMRLEQRDAGVRAMLAGLGEGERTAFLDELLRALPANDRQAILEGRTGETELGNLLKGTLSLLSEDRLSAEGRRGEGREERREGAEDREQRKAEPKPTGSLFEGAKK
ncbi:MAG: hypothetical protein V2A66_05545 [Pseudomonadota bacterium]